MDLDRDFVDRYMEMEMETVLEELGMDGGDEISKQFFVYLEELKNNKIQSLDLTSKYDLGVLGAKSLSITLLHNTSLIHLKLKDNNLKDKQVEYLAQALLKNTTLQRFDLSYNEIGDNGFKYLAQALLKNTALQYLDIICNDMGEEGAKHFSNLLLENTALRDLKIKFNPIGDKGAEYLAQALSENKTLQHLSLKQNRIGVYGTTCLIKSLLKNTTLLSFDISGGNNHKIMDLEGVVYFSEVLSKNTSLQFLHISDRFKILKKGKL